MLPSCSAIAELSRTSHSSDTRSFRQTVSAMVLNVTGRPVAGPKAPPRCVAVDTIRWDDRGPSSSSPHQITSSLISRRAGNSLSVAVVSALPAALPRLSPAGVRTTRSSSECQSSAEIRRPSQIVSVHRRM